MSEEITQAKAIEEWHTIRDSDAKAARLEARAKAAEHLIKQYWAQAFLDASGTVAERSAKADIDPRVIRAKNEAENASGDFKLALNSRKSAELYIGMWQTHSANNRQGINI